MNLKLRFNCYSRGAWLRITHWLLCLFIYCRYKSVVGRSNQQ